MTKIRDKGRKAPKPRHTAWSTKPKYAKTPKVSPVKIINMNTGEITEEPYYNPQQLRKIVGRRGQTLPLETYRPKPKKKK